MFHPGLLIVRGLCRRPQLSHVCCPFPIVATAYSTFPRPLTVNPVLAWPYHTCASTHGLHKQQSTWAGSQLSLCPSLYIDWPSLLLTSYISFCAFQVKISGDQHVVLSDRDIVDDSLSGWSRKEGQVCRSHTVLNMCMFFKCFVVFAHELRQAGVVISILLLPANCFCRVIAL